MTSVGVDGWRGGWVAAVLDDRRVTWTKHDTFAQVLATYPEGVVAVDMPIELGAGRHEADSAARRWLSCHGGPSSSIFNTPAEQFVDEWTPAAQHSAAMGAVARGSRVSIQAWNLIGKIRDVRAALNDIPNVRVVEAHPECTFRLIDPDNAHESKKTGLGVALRMAALDRVGLPVDLALAPSRVPVDDLLDAAVLIHTARRFGDHAADLVVRPEGATTAPRIVI